MRSRVRSRGLVITIDILAWGVFHAGTGYLAHRLSRRRLSHDRWPLGLRPFEADGRWYRQWHIDRWKDRLPEAGELFAGGISKRHLTTPDRAGLQLFVEETRRAELGHWMALACGPVFSVWNPPLASALHITYGVGVNLPFIAVQRYNRARAQVILDRRCTG